MDPDANPSIFWLLRQGAWFSGLPPALQRLIVQESDLRSYRKGWFVVREGEPPKGLFVVLEGRIRVVRNVGDGGEVLLHAGEAGCWFAYYSLFHRQRSIGSVVADSSVRVLLLGASKFERIIENEPRYFRAFADLALEHYAALFKYVSDLEGLRRERLLCTRLADMARLRRLEHPTAGPVAMHVSQSDLAGMLGLSRQRLNGLLTALQARGLIEVGFRCIRVLDEAGLRENRAAGDEHLLPPPKDVVRPGLLRPVRV